MEKFMKTAGGVGIAVAVLISVFLTPIQASAQLEIKSADGKSSIKFGVLGQVQAESLTTSDGKDTSNDLYLRRFRVIFGGNITENLAFFTETDSPNLGKTVKLSDGSKAKGSSDAYLQDAYITYNQSNGFKVDAGMLLFPVSHNAGQSAASLLGTDYGPYSFIWSDPIKARVGRDYGMQARGYLNNNHFEYRVALLQGVRGENSTNPFRIAARAVYYPFQHESGFFYAGSYLGDKKVLGIGVSLDHQDDYNVYGADVFLDYPLANKDVITIQVDHTHYDGGDFIADFPEQDVLFAEAAYYFQALKIAPFVQLNYDDKSNESIPDRQFMQAGLAYYVKGQNFNVKLGFGQYSVDKGEDQTQVLLRVQAFMF
jgi:Phosphate-selective porin O and P